VFTDRLTDTWKNLLNIKGEYISLRCALDRLNIMGGLIADADLEPNDLRQLQAVFR
jgi:hypothetical protein